MEISKVILYSVIGFLLLSFISGLTQGNRNYYNRPFGYGMMSNGYGGMNGGYMSGGMSGGYGAGMMGSGYGMGGRY